MATNEITRLGGLEIRRRERCNRIDVLPVPGRWHTFYICANCGQDLEVTTTGASYRHCRTWSVLDAEVSKGN